LLFHAEFVGLHLTWLVWLKHQVLVHLFAVAAC
jgi:hypothetical protein